MLTVGQLKRKLARLSDDRLVLLFDEQREFSCVHVSHVEVREVEWREDPSEPTGAKEKAIVIHPVN